MRKILITGASRGIGKAIALKLLKEGHSISLGVRRKEDLFNTPLDPKSNNPENFVVHSYDATKRESSREWVKSTVNSFKSIDTIIHCAGIFKRTNLIFKDNEIQDIEDLWKVNVMGPWILTKDAWKYLSMNNSARIIVLVSMSGKRSKGSLASYSMSKFALMSLCQTMRNEGWNKGIRVTAICPGWVNTDMAKEVNSFPKEEMTQPNDIANICSNLLNLANSSVPFEIALNCKLETSI
ncbi:SDR family NAD(P)-dependent oxidoreductase [Prochlorococcus marinus]|uniref:Short-chain dehydrogenase n=1 Tax=Prochlorococcus marinus XMU1408 TaxID=2213228 RepID=A0A318R3L3_PROMR|nr:SDR family NAD(P)-dependent oxidoreductase [Prochlorococcus marinus]MBW3041661.1 short-chain dehydrogenase [Prochlorococcus marinus str. XMU1408]PYE02814.1 short-chain dehydrogenase [Prochlorococcus marinus XMU1408]